MRTPTSTNNLIDIFVGVDIGKGFHSRRPLTPGRHAAEAPKVLASAEGFAAERHGF
jgi:hypothetical protein